MSTGTLVRMNGNRVGIMLRDWRQRRRLSQLDLALEAGVSTRHLSFVETGRARPSPEMVLHLAEQLQVPLRERNQLLLAAGYAPEFGARALDDPELAPIRDALGRVLAGHEPYPAIAVDRGWNLVASNGALEPLLQGVSEELLVPPVNCMRLSLHPEGLAPRILNLAEWRGASARSHGAADRADRRRVAARALRGARGLPGAAGRGPPLARRQRSWSSCG